MARLIKIIRILILTSFIFVGYGCAGNKKPEINLNSPNSKERLVYFARIETVCNSTEVITDPAVIKHKEEMLNRYGFFLGAEGYRGEKYYLDRCPTAQAIDSFFDIFWSEVRDPDRSTPANEYKEIIDSRIADIENEIFFQDADISGTRFLFNGGFRGDLARIYLLRGSPTIKSKMDNGQRLSNLMVWAYIDVSNRPLFVFLFYDKGHGYVLFRNQGAYSWTEIMDELARYRPTTNEDYEEIYRELLTNDSEGIFRYAINNFSYYSESEVNLERAIGPPPPDAITAKAIQPRILGRPEAPDENTITSRYAAVIPAHFRLVRNGDGTFISSLAIRYSDLDWQKSDRVYSSKFDLMVSITNLKTTETKEFQTGITVDITESLYNKQKDQYINLDIGYIINYLDNKTTLSGMLESLEKGEYEIKARFVHHKLKSGILYKYITIP